MASVKKALSKIINISNYFYWIDSMITLAWITSKGKTLKLIENRIPEIRENINISRWFYYESKSNPADLLTRCKDFVCFRQMTYGGGVVHFYLRKIFNILKITKVLLIMTSFYMKDL